MGAADSVNLHEQHLLLLDAQSGFSDVLALLGNLDPRLAPGGARADHSRVSWQDMTVEGIAANPVRVERAKLTRHSALAGPVPLSVDEAAALGLPDWAEKVCVLFTPRDREGEPPPDWFRDPDGRWRLFPGGLPEREEGRNLDMLVAIARRLQTGLRLADEPDLPAGRLLLPDYGLAHDLTVYSSMWLTPELLLERVRAVEPGARFPASISVAGTGAGAGDAPMLDGYAIEIPLRPDGRDVGEIELGVYVEEYPPALLVDLTEGAAAGANGSTSGAASGTATADATDGAPTAGASGATAPGAAGAADPATTSAGRPTTPDGEAAAQSPAFVGYQLRWIDPEWGSEERRDTAQYRADRAFAAGHIDAVASAIVRAGDGVVFDSDGFLVAEHQLG